MPFNIMFCRTKAHAEIQADYPELKKKFEKYLGKISPNMSESSLCLSTCFMHQAYGTRKGRFDTEDKRNLEK